MKKGLLILFILSSFNSKGTIHTIGVWGGYYQFVPASITIQLGDTLQWEPFAGLLPMMLHTITSDNIPVGAVSFDQVWQMPADTFFQYIPQVAGLYQYVCTPHIPNGMIGEFTVTNGSNPQTYVPDDNFEAYLENNGMGDGIALNDYVYISAIDTVTYLNVSSQNISDLTGIEGFTALTDLDCEDNQLSSLYVSNNTALASLKSRYNQLTSLDISNNTALTYFECDVNQLTSLDVSNNTSLTSLSCSVNQLTSLDVSNNTALIELDCFQNQLFSLDVSNNTSLTALSTRENLLTVLDVSQNTNLIGLGCDDNQLTSLDVSNNTVLEALECFNNQLTSLDLSNNTALMELYCFDNQLISLDVSNNTILTWLECDDNQLISLDIRNGNNTNMNISTINNTNLTCINVDDDSWSTVNWSDIDLQHYFSNNCSGTAIQEHSLKKELLKATDLLGRETKGNKNEPLFYIYDDGAVEKIIIIE